MLATRDLGCPVARNAAVRGFTLVEVMMVVMLLAVLGTIAALVLGAPMAQAKETALASVLHNVRTQIVMYQAQHLQVTPAGSTLGQVLVGNTDVAGNLGAGAGYPLGPYLQGPSVNPYNGRSDIKSIPVGSPLTPDDTSGWLYQTDGNTFTFAANSSGTDSIGNPLIGY
jgi:prepilin-type N-terminal cleavage/methylation domain-containing protein